MNATAKQTFILLNYKKVEIIIPLVSVIIIDLLTFVLQVIETASFKPDQNSGVHFFSIGVLEGSQLTTKTFPHLSRN